MSLSVGIVGIPNAGKSTLFNALLQRRIADVADYPFTTIEPNTGVVEVPDERLKKLSQVLGITKVIPAPIKFIDIAGLVKGAHKGEGLGNQFLSHIRETNAIIHVIRDFEEKSIPHYYGSIDPQRDKEIIDLELELGGIKKPILYVLNISKEKIKESAKKATPEFIVICAETGEGVEQLIKKAYQLLGLIVFYTIKGGKEVRAWPLREGETASDAAEEVHTDMAKGFIKIEIINWRDLVSLGSWTKVKKAGKIRVEGKDYQVQDGEVLEIKFH